MCGADCAAHVLRAIFAPPWFRPGRHATSFEVMTTRGRAVARKLAFMLATSVAFGVVPQITQASCSGNACNAFMVAGKSYSVSDKRATRSNRDRD